MEIGSEETVEMILVEKYKDSTHKNGYYWTADVNKGITKDTFSECVQAVIKECKAKSISIIPYSIGNGCINEYWLMIKKQTQ